MQDILNRYDSGDLAADEAIELIRLALSPKKRGRKPVNRSVKSMKRGRGRPKARLSEEDICRAVLIVRLAYWDIAKSQKKVMELRGILADYCECDDAYIGKTITRINKLMAISVTTKTTLLNGECVFSIGLPGEWRFKRIY